MEVILLQDVPNLGDKGALATVSEGYARNYLLPKHLAETASPGRIAEFRRRDSWQGQNCSRHTPCAVRSV